MGRTITFFYGIVAYVIFLASFLYAIGFVGNFLVPKGIDDGVQGPIVASMIINLLLLSVFAIQHSVMARPGFKRIWTRLIPKSAERSTYVLLSSFALVLIYALWRPITGVIWDQKRNHLGRGPSGRSLGWLAYRPDIDLHDRPLRSFRVEAGLFQPNANGVPAVGLSQGSVLPPGSPPDHVRLSHRLLGCTDDDGRSPSVCRRHHGLHLCRGEAFRRKGPSC